MGDPAGEFELVPKTLQSASVGGDLWLEDLEGDLFVDLLVEDPVDLAHPPFAQLFDDLEPAGKGAASGEIQGGGLEGFGEDDGFGFVRGGGRRRGNARPALGAELGVGGIIQMAFRTFHAHLPRELR